MDIYLNLRILHYLSPGRYMPPENSQRKAGDVWAAGLVVAEVFAQEVPFKACSTHVSYDGVNEHTVRKYSQILAYL